LGQFLAPFRVAGFLEVAENFIVDGQKFLLAVGSYITQIAGTGM